MKIYKDEKTGYEIVDLYPLKLEGDLYNRDECPVYEQSNLEEEVKEITVHRFLTKLLANPSDFFKTEDYEKIESKKKEIQKELESEEFKPEDEDAYRAIESLYVLGGTGSIDGYLRDRLAWNVYTDGFSVKQLFEYLDKPDLLIGEQVEILANKQESGAFFSFDELVFIERTRMIFSYLSKNPTKSMIVGREIKEAIEKERVINGSWLVYAKEYPQGIHCEHFSDNSYCGPCFWAIGATRLPIKVADVSLVTQDGKVIYQKK